MNRYKNIRPSCKTCAWWEAFSGVCCNGSSIYRGDFRDRDFGCINYAPNIHAGCGGLMEAREHANVIEHYCYGCLFTVLIDGKPIEETREFLKGGKDEKSKNQR